MPPPAVFALADCNNFYCSCERVFNPKLAGRPAVVLSNNDGCVIARSEEAKAAGITMGEPAHLAGEKLARGRVAVFSSNYALYGDMSRRVMDVYRELCPEVEVYSIDEAFLNLAGYESRGLEAFARDIRRTVGRWTGIPVSIGLGRTKVLAKVANRVATRTPEAAGVFDLTDPGRHDEVLARIAVGDVWGIGPRWAAKLEAAGVRTALELLTAAMRLLGRVYRPGHRYKKCGVMLTALGPATTARAGLIDDRDREKERRLMRAVDAVNARFGRGAVFFAGAAAPQAAIPRWTTKAAMRSPRYTTRFDELPVVRC